MESAVRKLRSISYFLNCIFGSIPR